MTRETKIGLLVGLAFIIVIGILLSDHLTSSNEPPQATLAVAGNNVRSGVTTPGLVTNPQISSNVTPAPLAPRTTVPTPIDLAPKAQPVQPVQVAVGGPSNPQTSALTQDEPRTSTAETSPPLSVAESRTTETPNTIAVDSDPVITKAPPITPGNDTLTQPARASSGDIAAALRDAAKQHGEELVSLGGGTPASAHPAAPVSTKQYVAVDGDSLSKIASKVLGANTKANREAIMNLNPSLKQNPDIVVVGKTYNVPAAPGAVSAGVPASAGMSPTPVVQAPPATPVAASAENWYTVKEGDSLWRIATDQCGSANAIPTIKELNKDTLKGDTIVVNTKLRLPNKVASAN